MVEDFQNIIRESYSHVRVGSRLSAFLKNRLFFKFELFQFLEGVQNCGKIKM